MDTYGKIKGSIKRICGTYKIIYIGTVESIQTNSCTVNISGLLISDVMMRGVVDNSEEKLLITPKIKSEVVLLDISGNLTRTYIIGYSEIDSIDIKIANQSFTANKDGFVFNGGNNAGIIKIEELQKMLKNLEDKFNQHTHSGVITAVVGQATGTEGSTAVPSQTSTEFQTQSLHPYNYEDEAIKH